MKIAREQMLCIVSAGWPGDPAALASPATGTALDRFFAGIGVVHFASIALLPPPPEGGAVALLLEMAVDEGIRPNDLLHHLAHHPDDALYAVYAPALDLPADAARSRRDAALLGLLTAGLSVCDGGFVGVRDRNLDQIRRERRLLAWVREAGRGLVERPLPTRQAVAAEIARKAAQRREFDWAQSPAPRSYWRAAGAGAVAKITLLLQIDALVCAALWAAQAIFVLGAGRLPSGDGVVAAVGREAAWAGAALQAVLGTALRLPLVLTGLALAHLLFFVLVPQLWPGGRRAIDAWLWELDSPSDTSAARASSVWAALLALALVPPAAVVTVFLFEGSGPAADQARALVRGVAGGQALLAGGYAAFVAVTVGYLLLAALARRWPAGYRVCHRAPPDEVPGAQQVHPAVEACEARLVTGTAHMVSLVELRRPYALSAFLTRAALRTVTFVGYLLYTEGKLGDAPGIQFSHWHIVDGRRLLFCANFDGYFGGYLDDFINGGSAGTTLFWRWTELHPREAASPGHPAVSRAVHFPPTRLLVFRGVKCEAQFKTYARQSMLPHLYRYDACTLSVDEKNLATDLRNALFAERADVADDVIARALDT